MDTPHCAQKASAKLLSPFRWILKDKKKMFKFVAFATLLTLVCYSVLRISNPIEESGFRVHGVMVIFSVEIMQHSTKYFSHQLKSLIDFAYLEKVSTKIFLGPA